MIEAQLAPNLPQWMKDHVDRYLKSGGTDGHMYSLNPPNAAPLTVPSLLLVTTGRKSGQKFLFPLFYGKTGNSTFVIASKGGAPEHPGWFRNIQADPNVEVQVGTAKIKARARVATGAERAKLWDQAVGFFPPYADYQIKSGSREIPVVVLEPVS
jgi:deazaflavin-dependent oxidoreductase (nitroreductase family)